MRKKVLQKKIFKISLFFLFALLFIAKNATAAQSDLIIQNLSVTPNSGSRGSNATVSFTIKNQGSGTAGASTTNIRINTSTANVTESNSYKFVSIATPSISAGGVHNIVQSVTIPTDRPIGNNYIWVILDVYSKANQSNENNDKGYVTFNVIILPPPSLIAPGASSEPGEVITTLTPTFKWSAVSGAARYGFYVSIYPYGEPNQEHKNENISTTSYTIPSGVLTNGSKYRWKAVAFDSGGGIGVISSPLYFQTQTNVTLTLYVHEGSRSGPIIAGAQVTGNDAGGTSFNQTTNSSGYVTITGKPGTWQFSVSKSGYQTKTWSQDITFTDTKDAYLIKAVVTFPPPAPTLVSPTNGSTVPTPTPTLDWDDVSANPAVDYYNVQIRLGSIVVTNQNFLTVSQFIVPSGFLSKGVTYNWYVYAHNSLGDGPISSIWDFTVKSESEKKNVTVSGVVRYENKIFNETGAGDPNASEFKPVRFARVEIVRDSDGTILAATETKADGTYSIEIKSFPDDRIWLRCYAEQQNTDYKIAVKRLDSGEPVHFASSGVRTVGAGATLTLSLDITETSGEGGAFNIFDCLIEGAKKVKELSGSPLPLVTVEWQKGVSARTAYYRSQSTIKLNGSTSDPAEYDDAVILHEYGHFIMDKLSLNKSPGGRHRLDDANQDIRLSWSEGWATYFSGIVRNNPLYINAGKIGTAEGWVLDIEKLKYSSLNDGPVFLVGTATGQDTETAVSSILWDIFDNPAGDDDPLGLGPQYIWNVFDNYITPGMDCVLEDFYQGWFSKFGENFYKTQINDIFTSRSVFYSDLAFNRGKIYIRADGRNIPDGNTVGIISACEIPDNLYLKDINVFVDLPHRRRSNIFMSLISPSNKEVILYNRTSVLPDYSEDIFAWYQEPYETIPYESLDNNFKNKNAKGTWRLKVIDSTLGYAGTLNLWKLEIKGTPAEIQLNLQPGWNFVSFPLLPEDKTIKEVLSSIEGRYDQVVRYNAQKEKFEYYVGKPRYNQFNTFEYLRGYEIYITDPNGCTLTITGQPIAAAQTIQLKTGWNLIGNVRSEELPVEEALMPLRLGIDYFPSVSRYNTFLKKYENYTDTQKEFTVFKPGESYFIKCLTDVDWAVEP